MAQSSRRSAPTGTPVERAIMRAYRSAVGEVLALWREGEKGASTDAAFQRELGLAIAQLQRLHSLAGSVGRKGN